MLFRSERGGRGRDEYRREHRRRDDDLGPSVVGFGDDVPAFMLVAVRPGRPAGTPAMDVEVEESEA